MLDIAAARSLTRVCLKDCMAMNIMMGRLLKYLTFVVNWLTYNAKLVSYVFYYVCLAKKMSAYFDKNGKIKMLIHVPLRCLLLLWLHRLPLPWLAMILTRLALCLTS